MKQQRVKADILYGDDSKSRTCSYQCKKRKKEKKVAEWQMQIFMIWVTVLIFSQLHRCLVDSVFSRCFLNVSHAHALSIAASSARRLGRFLEISESELSIMNKGGQAHKPERTRIQIYTL